MANPHATPITSAALIPFANHGADAPYRADGVLVTPLTLREGVDLGRPARRSNKHIIEAAAIAWEPDRCYIGARWLCGGGSSGIEILSRAGYVDFLKAWHKDEEVPLNDYLCQTCVEQSVYGGPRPCVYRVRDAKGRLLYIGSTKNWTARQAQHRQTTWWWHTGLVVELEYFDSIEKARAAETEAIQTEHPRQNIRHNKAVS